jgi:catechol 2,3-dioxygenase-like lactoylglutathione lyase family enzyme
MTTYDVGGVRLPRPFQIRRVSHIGLNCSDAPAMVRCYRDHLGLRSTDSSENLANRLDPDGELLTADGAREMHFLRYGADHHQFVLMHRQLWSLIDPEHQTVTINQLSWQVGSLAEVAGAVDYLGGEKQRILRSGRDMPGSNWHTYVLDPNGYTDELTFGMEQVGWDALSKPRTYWDSLRHRTFPDLPIASEFAEVEALPAGEVGTGFRPEAEEETYAVDGVLLARPFKVVGLGPFSIVVDDIDESLGFYRDLFGFRVRTRATHDGVDFALLACNSGHHALALYAPEVRECVGLPAGTSVFGVGFQLANHRQLLDAVAYLTERGYAEVDVPAELVPGFSHVTHLRDPDGNLMQLYFHQRQLPPGAADDGPPSVVGPAAAWPESIGAPADVFGGEIFMGPWG